MAERDPNGIDQHGPGAMPDAKSDWYRTWREVRMLERLFDEVLVDSGRPCRPTAPKGVPHFMAGWRLLQDRLPDTARVGYEWHSTDRLYRWLELRKPEGVI